MALKTWSLGIVNKIIGNRADGDQSSREHGTFQGPGIPSTPKKVNKQASAFSDAVSPKNANGLVKHLKSTGRFVVLLLPKVIDNLRADQLSEVIDILNREMSLVPEGPVAVEHGYIGEQPDVTARIEVVEQFFVDRFAVTNAEFKQFIEQGGYEDEALWNSEVLPAIGEFVDTTGKPGPRNWKNGNYPADKSEHPVVDVSWHEANAYARWVGKRLPTNAEWVKAASWPLVTDGKPTRQRSYPWGNIFDESNANVWVTGLSHTVRVDEFQNGNSASDVCQLSGNVWEWTADDFRVYSGNQLVAPEDTTKSLRGGAFDTYVERQASCQFESGDSPFARKRNIGFRCVVSFSQLAEEARVKIRELGIKSGPASFAPATSAPTSLVPSAARSPTPSPPRSPSPPPSATKSEARNESPTPEEKLDRRLQQICDRKAKKNAAAPKSNSPFAGPGEIE
jgi:iron(II)-dependent oxidoreductase